MQCLEKHDAGMVTRKWAARGVGTMKPRRETDHQ
jgi:hypothetical protein